MKPNKTEFAAVTLRSIMTFLSVVLLVLLSAPYSAAGKVVGWQAGQTVTTALEKKVTTAHEKKMIATFNRRVKDYQIGRAHV